MLLYELSGLIVYEYIIVVSLIIIVAIENYSFDVNITENKTNKW